MNQQRFVPTFEAVSELPSEALCFAFHKDEALVKTVGDKAVFPPLASLASISLESSSVFIVGHIGNTPCLAISLDHKPLLPEKSAFATLRALFDQLGDSEFAIAARAKQVLQWDFDHRYCGRCAAPTENGSGEPAKICTQCKFISFPRLCPAVIVLITKGDQILLARSPRFRPGVYSVLAGFVDAGESLEATIHREVMEEVGIKVKNLRYFDSQSWPFPQSLMIGFTAEYDRGEITIDGVEIEDAGWYDHESLPLIPHSRSISRQLIDHYLARFTANK